MKIYVVRHGITEWNFLRKVQGAADIPLAEEGIRLAKITGEHLKDVPFDICFTSPLIRAKKTAELVLGERFGKIPMIEDDRIKEINFGVLEGVQFKDEQGNMISPEIEQFFTNPYELERPKNAETIKDVCDRTRDFLMEKVADPSLQDKTILVASHGCAVRALLQSVYEDTSDFWHGKVPPNCSVNILEAADGKLRLLVEDKVFS